MATTFAEKSRWNNQLLSLETTQYRLQNKEGKFTEILCLEARSTLKLLNSRLQKL